MAGTLVRMLGSMTRPALALLCLVAALVALWAAVPEDAPPAAVDRVGEQEVEVAAEASIAAVEMAGGGQRVAAAPTQGSKEPESPDPEGSKSIRPGLATLRVSLENLDGEAFPSGVIVVSRVLSAAEEAAAAEEYDASIDYQVFDWSPVDDSLLLKPGRYKVRGFADLFEDRDLDEPFQAAVASPFETVDLVPGSNPPIVLVGRQRSGLQVAWEVEGGGRPFPRLLRMQPGEEVDGDALANADPTENGFGYVENGPDDPIWAFMDLEPGVYAVGASSFFGELYGYEVLTVGDAITRAELVCRPADDRRLSVSVTAPDGKRVSDPGKVRFSLERTRGGDALVVRGLSSPTEDGSFGVWFPGERGEFFDPTDSDARYTLLSTHRDHGQLRTQLQPGETTVSVAFGAACSIVVRLEDFEEGEFAARAVSLDQIQNGEPSLESRFGSIVTFGDPSRTEGSIESLTPGRYRVTLFAWSRTGAMLEESLVAWQLVDVLASNTPVIFRVPTLHELRVVAPGLSEEATISLSAADQDEVLRWGREPRTRELDAGRRCTFDVLAAGTHVLEAEGLEGPVRVTVPCGEVTLR